MFRNFYRCDRCGHEWSDDWSATCDDDCPNCGARHMSPYRSEDIPAAETIARGRVRPATARQATDIEIVVARLRDARDHARAADCPATLRKIRLALKSAEGARRHMQLRIAASAD